MSKSDAQRRSYLADQMTVMERVEAIERRVADLESSGTTRGPVRYLDPAGNIVDKGDPRRAPSPTECGRIVVDAGEWDRLQRIESEHSECKPKLEEANNLADALRRDWSDIAERLKAANFRTGNAIERYEAKLARAVRIEEAARAFRDQITFCGGVTLQRLHDELGEALKP